MTSVGAEPGRRGEIVEAAYRCVADKGMPGLRMRDVAAAAGVNIATVHYYLPSKTELVRAVVEYAHERFQRGAAPPPDLAPDRRLRVHLNKVFDLLDGDPHLGHVLAEVALLAERDAVVAGIVVAAERRWRRALRAMLAPLPRQQAESATALVMLAVKGACLPPAGRADLRVARRELARYAELNGPG